MIFGMLLGIERVGCFADHEVCCLRSFTQDVLG